MAFDLEKIPAALPGAPALGDDLRRSLAAGLSAAGKGYEPRTRHLRSDGSPLYTNRLFLESSPYLQQHAHNPVNWYPWGDEAFAAARELKRPVLLSIGYSTCHWCHVMEEESFEDVEVATLLNQLYIPIKVDREVRPDVDAIYMQAVQMMSGGRGGWPLNAWLTPDREPFFGGTYFPARDGDRGAQTGFLTLLQRISDVYHQDPARITQATGQIIAALKQGLGGQAVAAATKLPEKGVLERATAFFAAQFDAVEGGLNRAPKFPSSLPVRFLLRQHRHSGDPQTLAMATLSLEKMAGGGMYDQAGGGFHRYSTDSHWLVPHFEKMLYDNALLTQAYLEAWQVTGNQRFADVAADILRYVGRDMTAPGGGFYSATDADSKTPAGHMEEGWFFTWTPAEIRALLEEKSARLVIAYYGVTDRGNFEGRTILNITRPLAEVAAEQKIDAAAAARLVEAAREVLYEARKSRPAPLRDDKILAAWNGLMISAFARGGLVLDRSDYTRAAARAADFVLTRMRVDGHLKRSFKDGRAEHPSFLEDHAFMIAGLLDLYEADPDPRWLREAVALQAVLDARFADAERGGYYSTAADHEELLAREKPGYDGAEPSGNSVAALNLLRLAEFTTQDRYRLAADRVLMFYADTMARSPGALAEMLLALDFRLDEPREVVIVTPAAAAGSGADSVAAAQAMLAPLRRSFLPNRIVAIVPEGKAQKPHAEVVPLVEGKTAQDGKVTAYVCLRGACKLPTNDPAVFERQLLDESGAGEQPPGT